MQDYQIPDIFLCITGKNLLNLCLANLMLIMFKISVMKY